MAGLFWERKLLGVQKKYAKSHKMFIFHKDNFIYIISLKYWQDFSGRGSWWGLRKVIQKDLKCIFFYTDDFIYHIVEVLARLFWEKKLLGAQKKIYKKS